VSCLKLARECAEGKRTSRRFKVVGVVEWCPGPGSLLSLPSDGERPRGCTGMRRLLARMQVLRRRGSEPPLKGPLFPYFAERGNGKWEGRIPALEATEGRRTGVEKKV
jgi:hypothetical protein